MSVRKLLEKGVLKVAKEAHENPDELETRFCLGVAGKDYPAQTPRLWNAAFKAFGLKANNVRLVADHCDVEEIVTVLKRDPGYIGGDIGVGFKDGIVPHLCDCAGAAKEMQAVNVVTCRDGRLVGHNTDGIGFRVSLEEVLSTKGRKLERENVLLLGGGGTTNAITFALAEGGATLVILNRTVAKAEELAERLNKYFGKTVAKAGGRDRIGREALRAGTIVSVIDDPHSPLDQYSALGKIELPATKENIRVNLDDAKSILSSLSRSVVIADVMLRNKQTATLRTAAQAGFTVLDGKPMVFNQAVEAFWLVNEPELLKKGKTKADVAAAMRTAMK